MCEVLVFINIAIMHSYIYYRRYQLNNMIKLYRVWNEREHWSLKDGILLFDHINPSLITSSVNPTSKDNKVYKKHFLLTKEDAFIYSKYLDCEEKYVNIFCVPEELVLKNIGFANVRDEFFPLEVAIPTVEIKEEFKLESVNEDNPLEALYVKNSNIYLGEEEITNEKSLSYILFKQELNNIISAFYENYEFSPEKAKKFIDDEANRKMLVEKVKALQL